jgi:hypothetical protein
MKSWRSGKFERDLLNAAEILELLIQREEVTLAVQRVGISTQLRTQVQRLP